MRPGSRDGPGKCGGFPGLAALNNEPALLEDPEVLGDSGTGHGEVRGNLPGGQRVIPDKTDDLPPVRFGNGPYRVHGRIERVLSHISNNNHQEQHTCKASGVSHLPGEAAH